MQLLNIAETIIKKALRKSEQVEVFVMRSRGSALNIEKNSLGFSSSGEEFGIGIRVLKNSSLGFSYCTEIAKAEKCLEEAIKSSKLRRIEKFEFPYPKKTKSIRGVFDKKILNFSVKSCLESINTIINSAKEVNKDIIITNGGIVYGEMSYAIANSNGVSLEERNTAIICNVITVLKKKTTSTGFDYYFSRTLNYDFEKIGKSATELAVKTQNPKRVDGKEKEVIFTPYALNSMLEFAIIPAFYGNSANKGESVYSGKIGQVVCSEELSITEDSTYESGLNSSSFDDEGIPSKKTELVYRGILKNFIYDFTNAKEYNTEPTGNAVRCEKYATNRTYKSPPSIKSRNFIIQGRTSKFEEIIKETKNGVLIYDCLGAHTINPVSCDFSVNSSILFKVKNGEICYALKPIMLSGNMANCLKNVKAIGNDFKMLGGSLSTVSVIVPSLKVEGVKIT